MAARPALRVLNVEDVLRDLDRFGAASDELAAFGPIGVEVAEEAAARVHVQTGALRATITSYTGPNTAVVAAGDESTAPAGVINYRNPGDEFLTGPANERIAEREQAISDSIDELIRQYRLR